MARGRLFLPHNAPIEEPVINLTPLIDVVFVILIMFILIAPLLEMDLVELANSPSSLLPLSQNVQQSSPIAIRVYKDNTIQLNNQPVAIARLAEELRQAKTRYPKAAPQLFHDRSAHFGTYQSVKNAAEEAGFSEMEVILNPL